MILARIVPVMRCFCKFYPYHQRHPACLRSAGRRSALHRSARRSSHIILNSTAMESGKEPEPLHVSQIIKRKGGSQH